MKKHVLVTGGSGFIGKNIVDQLGRKYHIDAPSHKKLDLTNADAVTTYFKSHHIDIVIHTANVGGNKIESHISDVVAYNLRIFSNIIRCQKYFKQMIHLGSGAEFGKQLPIVHVKEDMLGDRIPTDDFGLYKYFVAKYIEETKLPIMNLRIFGIYGKYEEYRFRFISNVICQVLLGMSITIRQNALFDFIYIDDFIKILDHFILHTPKYKTYNIGGKTTFELLKLAHIIGNSLGCVGQIKVLHSGWGNEYTCDTTRLKKELPNYKYTDLNDSIQYLAHWYKKNFDTINVNNVKDFI